MPSKTYRFLIDFSSFHHLFGFDPANSRLLLTRQAHAHGQNILLRKSRGDFKPRHRPAMGFQPLQGASQLCDAALVHLQARTASVATEGAWNGVQEGQFTSICQLLRPKMDQKRLKWARTLGGGAVQP